MCISVKMVNITGSWGCMPTASQSRLEAGQLGNLQVGRAVLGMAAAGGSLAVVGIQVEGHSLVVVHIQLVLDMAVVGSGVAASLKLQVLVDGPFLGCGACEGGRRGNSSSKQCIWQSNLKSVHQ